MLLKVIVFAIVVLVFLITVAILYGANRWQSKTRELHAKMEAARLPISTESYNSHELDGLPAPGRTETLLARAYSANRIRRN